MNPIKLWQGASLTISVDSDRDLTGATDIEYIIDSNPKIQLSLAAGDITGVTATGFRVNVKPSDTDGIKSGEYRHQIRATEGSSVTQGQFSPSVLRIADSIFDTTP